MNPLTSLPARVRQGLYVGYGLLVIVYGALTAAYLQDPEWLDVAGRVLTPLAVPFAALAATHVTPTPPEQPEGETFGSTAAERDELEGSEYPDRADRTDGGRMWPTQEGLDGWVADAPARDSGEYDPEPPVGERA